MFRVWYSSPSLASFVCDHTTLGKEEERGNLIRSRIYESDASKPRDFHTVPTHIKDILYLDSPDLIVEKDGDPIFSLEVSTEAGTGHNAFQRFARIAASVENKVPAFYVYPEAVYIHRRSRSGWDTLNPLIFFALEKMMRIYRIPALIYYFPSLYGETDEPTSTKGLLLSGADYLGCPEADASEMQTLFEHIDIVLDHARSNLPLDRLLNRKALGQRRDWMQEQYHDRGGHTRQWSPLTATCVVPTELLIGYLRLFAGDSYEFAGFLQEREETLVYSANAKFRGDPYCGALAAIDYLECRTGETFEERDRNLVMAWGRFEAGEGGLSVVGDEGRSIGRFVADVRTVYEHPNRLLLGRRYSELSGYEIPRYFMQVRFGSTFTKRKRIRVYSYFCDAILFPDGVLWREG